MSVSKLVKPFTEDELAKALDGVITRTRDAARVLKFRSCPGAVVPARRRMSTVLASLSGRRLLLDQRSCGITHQPDDPGKIALRLAAFDVL